MPATVSVPNSDIAWALTWNSGSAVRHRSPSSSHRQWTASSPARRQLACVNITALGFRVVPEVKISSARSFDETGTSGGSVSLPMSCSNGICDPADSPTTATFAAEPASAIASVTTSTSAVSVTTSGASVTSSMCCSSPAVLATFDGAIAAPSRAAANHAISSSGRLTRWITTNWPGPTPSSCRPPAQRRTSRSNSA